MRKTCNVGLIKNNGEAVIFAGAVRRTFRITSHIFRTTFAIFIGAVPLAVAVYKSLLTSRRYHSG
jgi:hypothetical protein